MAAEEILDPDGKALPKPQHDKTADASAAKHKMTATAGITVSSTSAQPGVTITITVNDQTITVIDADGREIAKISGYTGTFTIPASNVTLSIIPTSNMFVETIIPLYLTEKM